MTRSALPLGNEEMWLEDLAAASDPAHAAAVLPPAPNMPSSWRKMQVYGFAYRTYQKDGDGRICHVVWEKRAVERTSACFTESRRNDEYGSHYKTFYM
ncbi:MAG TPA: hypothetical protein VFQ39_01770 [Longimicrobium sp.]|nr:hypothetical protein [Longimicrobium sp.]